MPLAVAVPWLAALEMLQVSVSPLGSLAVSVTLNGVGEPSSLIVTDTDVPCVMTGGWFDTAEPESATVRVMNTGSVTGTLRLPL